MKPTIIKNLTITGALAACFLLSASTLLPAEPAVLNPVQKVVFDTSLLQCVIDNEPSTVGQLSPSSGLCLFSFKDIVIKPETEVIIRGDRPLWLHGEEQAWIGTRLRLAGQNGGVGGGGIAVTSRGPVILTAVDLGGGDGGEGDPPGGGGEAGWLSVSAGTHAWVGTINLQGGRGGKSFHHPYSNGPTGAGGRLFLSAPAGVQGPARFVGCRDGLYYLNGTAVAVPSESQPYRAAVASDQFPVTLLVANQRTADQDVMAPANAPAFSPYTIRCVGYDQITPLGQEKIRDCSIATLTCLLNHLAAVEAQRFNRMPARLSYEKIRDMLRKGPWSYRNQGDYIDTVNFQNVANWGLRELGLPGALVARRAADMNDVELALRESGAPVVISYMTPIFKTNCAKVIGVGRAILKGFTLGLADPEPIVSDYLHCGLVVAVERRGGSAGYQRFFEAVDPWRGICFKRKMGRFVVFEENELRERYLSYDTAGIAGKSKMLEKFRTLAPPGSMLVYQRSAVTGLR